MEVGDDGRIGMTRSAEDGAAGWVGDSRVIGCGDLMESSLLYNQHGHLGKYDQNSRIVTVEGGETARMMKSDGDDGMNGECDTERM